jgi:hypothetical protein
VEVCNWRSADVERLAYLSTLNQFRIWWLLWWVSVFLSPLLSDIGLVSDLLILKTVCSIQFSDHRKNVEALKVEGSDKSQGVGLRQKSLQLKSLKKFQLISFAEPQFLCLAVSTMQSATTCRACLYFAKLALIFQHFRCSGNICAPVVKNTQ